MEFSEFLVFINISPTTPTPQSQTTWKGILILFTNNFLAPLSLKNCGVEVMPAVKIYDNQFEITIFSAVSSLICRRTERKIGKQYIFRYPSFHCLVSFGLRLFLDVMCLSENRFLSNALNLSNVLLIHNPAKSEQT